MMIYESTETEEFSIGMYVENPYDYGSEEYFSAMEKINANREKYRKKVLERQYIKNSFNRER